VYTADPKKDATATRYATLSFDERSATILRCLTRLRLPCAARQKLPLVVFDIFKPVR